MNHGVESFGTLPQTKTFTNMTPQEIERATALFKEKLTIWCNNKEKEHSAYEYEKTFVETMQKIEKDVLQIMTETKAKSRNAKKKYKPL